MPVVVGLYCVVLLVVLPLLVWELYREGTPDEFKAWFVAGIFMLLTIPVFLVGLVQHLLNYTQPHLQKHIIRCTDICLSFAYPPKAPIRCFSSTARMDFP